MAHVACGMNIKMDMDTNKNTDKGMDTDMDSGPVNFNGRGNDIHRIGCRIYL